MKKFLAIAVAMLMVLAMSTAVFATPAPTTGTITVTNATIGKTYTIYKVFDATYAGTNVTYTYTATGASDPFYAALTAAGSPFTLTATSTPNVYTVTSTADAATIAAWLKTNKALLEQVGEPVVADSSTVTFSGLDFGYYYIDTNNGAAVTIDSAIPTAEVIDKNQTPHWPGPDEGKLVWNGTTWVDSNNLNIGDTVSYKITFEATNYDGETKITHYTIHDTMAGGLANPRNFVVTVTDENGTHTITPYVEGTNPYGYTLTMNPADGHTFDINIPWVNASGNSIYGANAEIVVTYDATLDTDALIDSANKNTASVTWDGDSVPDDDTDTYTFDFDVHKENGDGDALQGVTFELWLDAAGTNKVRFELVNGVYRVCTLADCTAQHTTTLTTDATGNIAVDGLAAGTYYLHEVSTLPGYNLLTADIPVVIDANGTVSITGSLGSIDNGVITVVNNSGSELPSTGGIGTTIFYVVGGLMMAAAVVLLVTRKKMSVED